MSDRDARAPDVELDGAAAGVEIYEVGPRDGLQNEAELVPTESKRELIARLASAGLRRIEVASFVSPRWIPQLADADALAAALPRARGVRFAALVPNEQGYARLRAAGSIEIAATFISASETHNRKNANCSIAEQLARLAPVYERARADGIALRAYVSTVCGCPYEGAVAVAAVVDLARQLAALGADEISLGDTIGVGTPSQVRELVRAVAAELPLERIALHLHDTYGRALANAQAGFEAGVRCFDSSLAGLGGCPYAPGASGNVATEDLVDLFEREGVRTGVDLEALVDASAWLEREVLARKLPGRVLRAKLGARERAQVRE
ncbi:MAG TPA: hydroxymethylglutaryl-CoA lyase [Myxococcota bacterium]|nr:hydroxymethylglutaryl-CoA lyase [Myxococcota bacterium]